MTNEEIQQLLDQATAATTVAGVDLAHAKDLIAQARAALDQQPPPPPPTPPVTDWRDNAGFATGDIWQNTGSYGTVGLAGKPQSYWCDLINEAGGRLIRTSWYGIAHDDEINLALNKGLRPVVTFQPITGNQAGFVNFAQRFKGRVPFYELGNEPDLHSIPPATYAAIVKQLAPQIKQADPACQILTGGLWLGTSTTAKPNAYCQALIDAGALGSVDFFTLHYPDDGGMRPYMGICRGLLDSAFLQRVRLASTEGGGGKNTTDQTQAARCQQFLDWLRDGTLGLATCFSILPDYDLGFEFVRANGTRRPAFQTFKAAVAAA